MEDERWSLEVRSSWGTCGCVDGGSRCVAPRQRQEAAKLYGNDADTLATTQSAVTVSLRKFLPCESFCPLDFRARGGFVFFKISIVTNSRVSASDF